MQALFIFVRWVVRVQKNEMCLRCCHLRVKLGRIGCFIVLIEVQQMSLEVCQMNNNLWQIVLEVCQISNGLCQINFDRCQVCLG